MAARWMWRCQASITHPVNNQTSSPVAISGACRTGKEGRDMRRASRRGMRPARWARAPAVVSPTSTRWYPSTL